MEVRVEGVAELRRNLRKVNRDLPHAMKGIHDNVAGPVAVLARSKARRKSGTMAGTIRTRSTITMARIEAGKGIRYAGVQHFGWPGHSISPNPYLTDAITEREAATIRLYDQLLGEAIERGWV